VDDGRRLVVNADLEAGRVPIDELNRALRLDCCDGGGDVLRDDVAAVEERARHVLPVARVALDRHVRRLEQRVCDLWTVSCSCVARMELHGSMSAVETCGAG
jgi:hypothetical protein